MLKINNLQVVFNEDTANEKKAIDDLNLILHQGDFITVIGSNGAGKSTLLNCISGSIPIKQGEIVLNNKCINSLKEHKRSKMIGRLFQDPLKGTAPNMTILENLELAYRRGSKNNSVYHRFLKIGVNKEEKAMFQSYLKRLDLGLENRLNTKAGNLSGGQRQALTLLMATINPPALLLLDEHTAALDPKTAKKVMQITNNLIHENNTTTIMITHNIEHALQYGNRMIVMSEGKIILDFSKEEKENMSVEEVMKIYAATNAKELSDKMILK